MHSQVGKYLQKLKHQEAFDSENPPDVGRASPFSFTQILLLVLALETKLLFELEQTRNFVQDSSAALKSQKDCSHWEINSVE